MTLFQTRRQFLKTTAVMAPSVVAMGSSVALAEKLKVPPQAPLPWFRRTLRWGQTNITEIDPERYDIKWWRGYWKRTQTQGLVINAGGIVAYYPTRVPFHRQAEGLNGRDLFGELCQATHEDGLVVFARMDSNRAHEELYRAHSDWFAVNASGEPYKAGDLFVTCINSPYYAQHIPAILREIIERYHPEGFTDNSWSGLGRSSPCYCKNCQERFRDHAGESIPTRPDWESAVYRKWINWNYLRRLELWDMNNRVTKAAGGQECIWVGMNSGSIPAQCQSFRDYRAICARTEMLMLDHQSRSDADGFQQNGEIGKMLHGMLGWDKLIPESMAMYQAGRPTFRFASKPASEAHLWMLDGIAGGLQPWWHHVGAYHEDRRMYHTAGPVYQWHKTAEEFLINRLPLAKVGLVWSQANTDFYGRDSADLMVEAPWRGFTHALVRARIPYLPVHADDIERDSSQFSVLVLPNLAAMSDAQAAAVKSFVARGGNLIATGHTSLFNELGDPRQDFALAELFGAHVVLPCGACKEATRRQAATETQHTYLRLLPELRAHTGGPHIASEPKITSARHQVLQGFEETDLLPFGGTLEPLTLMPGAQVLATFVPPFPVYPPEKSWMRQPSTTIPGLIINSAPGGSRVVFLPADVDRRLAQDYLPDHANLLASAVRWAAGPESLLYVKGPGLLDCHLYHQPGRIILHIVNLTNSAERRQPVDELIPVGPFEVRIQIPADVSGKTLRLLVSGTKAHVSRAKRQVLFTIPSILEHEVAVVS